MAGKNGIDRSYLATETTKNYVKDEAAFRSIKNSLSKMGSDYSKMYEVAKAGKHLLMGIDLQLKQEGIDDV